MHTTIASNSTSIQSSNCERIHAESSNISIRVSSKTMAQLAEDAC